MNAEEEWRPVVGIEGYLVSDLGRVLSVKRRKARFISLVSQPHGYLQAGLRDANGKRITRRVHSLVAAAFIGPRPEGMEVRHLDGNPANNTLANLAYSTHGDNMRDQLTHGTHHNAGKTHCPGGHPYSADNTYTSGGGRTCKTCHQARKQRRMQAVAA